MNTLQDLTRMDSIPVGMTLDGLAALRNRQQEEQLNLDDIVRKQAQQREMDPLLIQQQQLNNQNQGLMNQKTGFELNSMARKSAAEQALFGPTQQAKLKELVAKANDEDAKIFEQQIYEKLRAARPGSAEHSALMKTLETTRGFIEEKRKHEHAMEIARGHDRTQLTLEQMRIDAGKYQKLQTLKIGFDYELSKADNAIKKNAVLDTWLTRARNDPELAPMIPMLEEMFTRNKPAYEAEVKARSVTGEGGVDLTRIGNIPTVPSKPVTAPVERVPTPTPAASSPTPSPQKFTPQHEDWISRAMKANPGMTREQIIEQGTKLGKFK